MSNEQIMNSRAESTMSQASSDNESMMNRRSIDNEQMMNRHLLETDHPMNRQFEVYNRKSHPDMETINGLESSSRNRETGSSKRKKWKLFNIFRKKEARCTCYLGQQFQEPQGWPMVLKIKLEDLLKLRSASFV